MTYWVPFTVSRNDTQEIGCHTIMKPIYHYLQPTYYIILGKKSGVSQGFFLKKIWKWKISCLKFPIADYLCEIPLRYIFYIGLVIYIYLKSSINSLLTVELLTLKNLLETQDRTTKNVFIFVIYFGLALLHAIITV